MPEKKEVTLGTKDVADRLKIDPKYLRTILRSLDKYNDSGHTRYEWKKDDPFLDKLPGIVKKYKEEHERAAKDKAEKKKVETKPAAKTAAKAETKPAAKKKAVAKKKSTPKAKPAETPAPADGGDGIEEVA